MSPHVSRVFSRMFPACFSLGLVACLWVAVQREALAADQMQLLDTPNEAKEVTNVIITQQKFDDFGIRMKRGTDDSSLEEENESTGNINIYESSEDIKMMKTNHDFNSSLENSSNESASDKNHSDEHIPLKTKMLFSTITGNNSSETASEEDRNKEASPFNAGKKLEDTNDENSNEIESEGFSLLDTSHDSINTNDTNSDEEESGEVESGEDISEEDSRTENKKDSNDPLGKHSDESLSTEDNSSEGIDASPLTGDDNAMIQESSDTTLLNPPDLKIKSDSKAAVKNSSETENIEPNIPEQKVNSPKSLIYRNKNNINTDNTSDATININTKNYESSDSSTESSNSSNFARADKYVHETASGSSGAVVIFLFFLMSIGFLTFLGIYFRKLSFSRSRYGFHMPLPMMEMEEDEIALFERESRYSSWDAVPMV